MGIRERLSGNEAVAYALKQINPDVMGAFPITPSTEIPQYFSQYVANGEVDTAFIPVESEHSALSACIGAEAAGARAVTATSSCGLALMWELLYVAASSRLPITLACVNRALSGPININNDHSDSMGARDSGWLQLYAETNQEAYDNMLQAMRIAEHPDVQLPVMVCQDGFITSHAIENIELVETDAVRAFVGQYRPEHSLLGPEPMSVGPYDVPAYYMEHKRHQAQGMINAKRVILDVAREFERMTGRGYGLIETYRMEDAECALVLIGSSAGTAKAEVERLRAAGTRGGLPALPGGGTRGGAPKLRRRRGNGQVRGLLRGGRPAVRGGLRGPVRRRAASPARQLYLRPRRAGCDGGQHGAGVWRARGDAPVRSGGGALPLAGCAGIRRRKHVIQLKGRTGETRAALGRAPDVRGMRVPHRGQDGAARRQTGGPGGRLLRDRLSRGVHVFISVYGLEGQLYPQRV